MDFTKITCIAETCKDKHIIMEGAGGYCGPRLITAKVKCPECGLVLLIIPMQQQFEYSITPTTEQERRDKAIQREIEKNELDLARKINELQKQKF